ncbi:MAG TPA: penicillin-binding transpeptidase domain-containing protein [Oscillospiraceae bacterium]|nr:penicillin-binding transpeptidase domain-containing protein [Oscillospiraceae bacterium]HPF56449.1 penicillin-binding transpeptidase domain-containing protein [Clostridiales bacterium]HPK35878.1 penicillin-binding transpeptidase domain-containing protein [Oscillospiraceae bacterium]HPR76355.1 penicillin-binding transpeptidase domain-containing protein [Oscillospiraceae bacterium]
MSKTELPVSGSSPKMKRRLIILGIIICAVIAPVLVASLFNIQFLATHNGKSYAQLALENQLKDYTITPIRGTIYDRNYKVLAQNATCWMLDLYPSEIRKLDDGTAEGSQKAETLRNLLADNLSVILDMDRETVYNYTQKNVSYVCVKRKIEKEQADQISAFIADNKLSCISLATDTKRYYPYGNFAATLLGFTGTDNQGLYGVELYYDELLKGTPGRIISLKNGINVNMPSEYETTIDAEDGASLVLTIDEVVQLYLEKHLEAAVEDHNVTNRAAGIIMDVNTGAILAMATKGDYNPNEPFTIDSEEIREELTKLDPDKYKAALSVAQNDQWRNKITSEVYEPGSVFKIITAASALEEGVVDLDDTFTCNGYLQVADRRISCWKAGGHGVQTFGEALGNSCNVAFMQIGARLGATKFMEYYEAFGLTEKTGIDLSGEEIGIAHDVEEMGPVELAVSSFGQTFKVTPLQMITAVSAVANGGNLMQPYIVKSVVSADGVVQQTTTPTVRRQVISEETSDTMCELLEQVVSSGTGRNAYVAGYRVAGKTGTSEKIDLYDEEGNKLNEVIASFCGFAPADDPQIAILVILDQPHSFSNFGGQIAAPLVADILGDVLPYLGIEPIYTEEELANLSVTTPDVTGKSKSAADKTLTNKGLKMQAVGSGDTVLYQVPAAGSSIPKGGTVVVAFGSDSVKTVVVPDLTGDSVGTANSKLTNRDLNISIVGARAGSSEAIIASQSPAAGTEVEIGTVVEIRLRYTDSVE